MSGTDSKKAKRRRVKKPSATTKSPDKCSAEDDLGSSVDGETFKSLEKLMDANDDENAAMRMLSFPRGSNPFLDRERCLLCNCERVDPPETADTQSNQESEDSKSTDSNPLSQLPLWVCPSCRKSADAEIEKKPNIEQFLEQDFNDDTTFLPEISIHPGSEPTTPNGTLCSCDACTERRLIQCDHNKETEELQQCWMELRKLVRYLYGHRDDAATLDDAPTSAGLPDEDTAKDLVHKLCSRDPHQLFLRMESQVREFVIEMKVKLLKQLSTGFKTPPQAKKFIALLLDEYAHLCRIARKMAGLLKELQDHLKRFKVTWDLHNKHLFQSIAYSEPSIRNSINLLITQLRLGASSKEAYSEDTYPNLLHRYYSFEDEMSVIAVVWRDCHQLIETYNEEQSAIKLKQKMLREDWEFFKQQRKLLEQQVSKNPKANLSHNLEAQFTETMRLMLQGSKPSQDELLCPRCNRKRCPCDECTITHMITCGIINPEVLESQHHNAAHGTGNIGHHGNFMHDPNRYRIDVSPPSMSSTTSSSGSSSPIMVDPERLALPFPDDAQENGEEIPEELEDGQSYDYDDDDDDDDDDEGDDDDEDGDDEEEDDDDDQDSVSCKGDKDTTTMEARFKAMENLPTVKGLVEVSLPSLSAEEEAESGKLSGCSCDHCVSQAKLEQVIKAEDNQCQCHVCLQQQGNQISTSLPQPVPAIVPRPGELHLYPHIHGSTGLHSMGRGGPAGHVRPILYDLHLPLQQQRQKSIMQTKVPIKLDFDSPEGIHDHIYHAYGDWDNTYDARMLLGNGKFDSELLPPPPFSSPYTSSLLTEPFSVPGGFSTSTTPVISSISSTSAFTTTITNNVPATLVPTSAKLPDAVSVSSGRESIAEPAAKTSKCNNGQSGSPVKAHPPPCTRPATLGGNNTPKVMEKQQHSQHCRKHNPQPPPKQGAVPNHNHKGQMAGMTPEFMQTKEGRHMVQQLASKLKQPGMCSHLRDQQPNHGFPGLVDPHTGVGACPNSVPLPTTVNNVSVGTSTVCTEPDCDGNHDDNYDSIDDSCSEQSSSASNSNQKEGKYCDCCYCEFFGHGNPPMAPTSKNYAEMRDKLRLRLKKKNETKPDDLPIEPCEVVKPVGPTPQPKAVVVAPEPEDPLDTKGLDELLKFINGTEDNGGEKQLSAKAAKRARQKLRKAEEKARQEAELIRQEQERQKALAAAALAEAEAQLKQQQQQQRQNKKKRRKEKAAELAKASSGNPASNESSSTASVDTTDLRTSQKNQKKKKGKHKGDGDQGSATCDNSDNPSHLSGAAPSKPTSQASTYIRGPPGSTHIRGPPGSTEHTTASPGGPGLARRPTPQGASQQPAATANLNNRIVFSAVQHKNEASSHLQATTANSGNLNANILSPNLHVGLTKEQVQQLQQHSLAAITQQQQELLKQRTQQLIQMKLQQEAKKQIQLAQQAQQNDMQQTPQMKFQQDAKKQIQQAQQNDLQQTPQLKFTQDAKKHFQFLQAQQAMLHDMQQTPQASETQQTPPSSQPQQTSPAKPPQLSAAKQQQLGSIIQLAQQQKLQQLNGKQPQLTKQQTQPPQQQKPQQQQPQQQQSQNDKGKKNSNPGKNGQKPTPAQSRSTTPWSITELPRNNKSAKNSNSRSSTPSQAPNGSELNNNQNKVPNNKAAQQHTSIVPTQPEQVALPPVQVRGQINFEGQGQNPSLGKKGKKVENGQQNHIISPRQQRNPVPTTVVIQNGPPIPQSPVKVAGQTVKVEGQTRPSPQGQARNGEVPRMERKRQEQSKTRQEESPPSDQGKGKNKKTKKKNRGPEDANFIDEVFIPKSESDMEGGDMDDYEREIEEFKRFCADSSTPTGREKLQVNVNLKDIFSKKKSSVSCG